MPISVVIPAFNEAAGIARTLRALTGAAAADLDVVVAANGCTDGTAEVARSYGVRVLELPIASKTAALDAADQVAAGFPRVYLDADTPVTPELVRALAQALTRPEVLAAVPRRVVDATASSWPVRAFYAINSRLPIYQGRLFGRGVVALSRPARERFGTWPDLVADDLLLDAVVTRAEKCEIDAEVRVRAPARTGELVRRLARARWGNRQFRQWAGSSPPGVTLADPAQHAAARSWLLDVVAPAPRLWPAALCYLGILALAAIRRGRPSWSARSGWGTRQHGDLGQF